MLLIGITGPPGAGKTTLLSETAAWMASRGKRVAGFVSEGDGERSPGKGAEAYVLRDLATGDRRALAKQRAPEMRGYDFDEAAFDEAGQWISRIDPSPDLIVLDELGKIESSGGGLAAHWPLVLEREPAVVLASVRDGAAEAIQAVLGHPFDVVVRADDPDAPAQLQSLLMDAEDWQRIGAYGAAAGGIEMTVGSAMHAMMIPLRGLFMSTVQAAVMVFAGERLGRRRRVVWVPYISAGLKALSPAGSRIRPMIAIVMQGQLFAAATVVLGWNYAGVFVGGALVGAWALLQGIVLQMLFLGTAVLDAIGAVTAWTAALMGTRTPTVFLVLAVMVGAWAAIAGTVSAVIFHRRHREPARLEAAVRSRTSRVTADVATSKREAARKGTRDLLKPSFWLPIAIILVILALSGSGGERLAWLAFRALATGFVLFALIRLIRPDAAARWLRRTGRWGPALALQRALGGGGR
ncbi:hypothetical protein BH23BAC4_BH23BAC4_11860 [soil metagenome]